MSSSGTLSYYDINKKIFKTISIHHIEIDSLDILNKYYSNENKVEELINIGNLSYFTEDEIKANDDEKILISNSIEELEILTNSWFLFHYVYFLGNWYSGINDVRQFIILNEKYKNF
jgi:hypothetical protein